MSSFVRNQSIAVTWTTDTCKTVRLQVSGNVCHVVKCWSGTLGKDGASLAELLLNALKAVEADDNIYVIAGGNGQGWGMADLEMPTLKPAEMRAALGFELRKQTPLASDKLRWGFRLLPKKQGATKQPVRLYYVRNEHWNSWLKAADGLHHIDAMFPAPVALDPVLADGTLVIPGGHGIPGSYEYVPTETGRQVLPHDDNAPLSLTDVLGKTPCKLGPVVDQPPELQVAFASTIVLALYGLTNAVSADQTTCIPLPERFHARRNIPAKVTAACLGVILLGLLVYSLAGNLSGRAAQIRQIENEIGKTKTALEELRKSNSGDNAQRSELIKNELQDNMPNRPDFPSVLLAVTKAVPTTHWISDGFEWRDGKDGTTVAFKVQGSMKDVELTARLEDSKFLGNVTERQSSFNNGLYTQRFEALARFDTAIEADVLKSREEVQKQRDKERLDREKVVAEKLAAKEAAASKEEEEEDDEEDVPAPATENQEE